MPTTLGVEVTTHLTEKIVVGLVMIVAVVGGSGIISSFIRGSQAASSAPLSHPRMLLGTERLSQLQAAACYNGSGSQLPNCTPTVHWADFLSNVTYCMTNGCSASRAGGKSFALAHLVTGNTAYRDKAISAVLGEITNGLAGEHGQQILDANRIVDSAAFVYDWLNDELSVDQRNLITGYLNRVVQEMYFQHAKSSDPGVNPYYTHNQWGMSDETNNYFYAHLLVATYAGVATYGENDFRVPLDITNPACSFYTNKQGCPTNTMDIYLGGQAPNHFNEIIPFVYAKLDREGVPYLNTYGKGGGWQEGNQYGAASFSWSSLILQQAGFRDYFATTDYSREHVRFYLHSVQPGDDFIHPLGDAGREKTFRVSPYEREDMLVLAAGLAGTIESEYAQYYLNHIQTGIPSGWQQSLFKNFLLQNSSLPERNYKAELPTLYQAQGLGWINARSSWADDAVSLSFGSTAHTATAHQHKDQNSFDIYKGDGSLAGWQTGDANTCDGSNGIGDSENTKFHNSILVDGQGQFRYYNTPIPSFGEILKAGSGDGYHYLVGEAANAYLDTSNNQRTVSRFTREIVHVFPGFVVLYDRITPTAGYQDSTIIELFQYKGNPSVSDNIISHSGGAGKIFQTIVLPSTGYTVQPVQNVFNWSGADHASSCYRVQLETATPAADYRFLNLFEITDVDQSQSHAAVALTSTDTAWEGVFINGNDRAVIMFSKSGSTLAAPLSYSYQPTIPDSTKHIVVNVEPNTAYTVFANGQSQSVVQSSAHGVLAFSVTNVGTTTISLSEGGGVPGNEEDVTPPEAIDDLTAF